MEKRGVIIILILIVGAAILFSSFGEKTGYAGRQQGNYLQPGESNFQLASTTSPVFCECRVDTTRTTSESYTCLDGSQGERRCEWRCKKSSDCKEVLVYTPPDRIYPYGLTTTYSGMWKHHSCKILCPVH